MDIFQIGEYCNALSDDTKEKICKRDLRGIINLRNFIAHGYVLIEEDIIWQSIHNDLPKLINELNHLSSI